MALVLKSLADIQALINGPDYASIDVATKTKIAQHFEEMLPNVLEAAYDIIVTTLPTDQANFAAALFTTAPTAPSNPTTPVTPAPTPTTGEQSGLIPIPAGADQVTIPFSPTFSAAPLPPQCTVLKAAATDDNIAVEDIVSLTAAQCVAVLSSPTPNANYQLSFRVIPA